MPVHVASTVLCALTKTRLRIRYVHSPPRVHRWKHNLVNKPRRRQTGDLTHAYRPWQLRVCGLHEKCRVMTAAGMLRTGMSKTCIVAACPRMLVMPGASAPRGSVVLIQALSSSGAAMGIIYYSGCSRRLHSHARTC